MRFRIAGCMLAAVARVAAAGPETDEEELALIYGDRATVSIATGSQQALRRAPAIASVITAEMIAAMGANDLDQVLETVAGMHVSRSNSTWAPLFIVRGIYQQYNSQTLLMMNGIPVTTLLVGNKGNIWGGYPVENIARIEIIRGPGSALYGADAFAGVINIITRSATDKPGTTFGAHAGQLNKRDAWVRHAGNAGPFALAVYASKGHDDRTDAVLEADAQTRNDTAFGSHASLAPGVVNASIDSADGALELSAGEWRWRSGYKLRNHAGAGAGVAQALDPTHGAGSKRITSDLSWNATPSDTWSVGATVSYMSYAQTFLVPLQLFPPGTRFPTGVFTNGMLGGPMTWERQWRLSAFASFTGWKGHRARIGVGHDDLDMYQIKELKNFTFLPNGLPVPAGDLKYYTGALSFLEPHQRSVDYLYAQDEWQLGKDWALTAGIRHDRYSDTGSTTNPRLALVWDASVNLTAKLLYGQAFRAPSFTELYSINNPVVIGNAGVLPERIRTVEAALAWQPHTDLSISGSIYRYHMRDIIRTVANPIAGTGATWQNTSGQTGHGAELELSWEASRSLSLHAVHSWQQSTDDATGHDAGYVPQQHLNLRGDWRFAEGWRFGPQWNWIGERKRSPGDARAPLKGYNTLDLILRADGRSGWSVTASVLNVAGSDAREPSLAPGLNIPKDLPVAPRTLQVGVSWQL